MTPEQENFDGLRRLLKLKRLEQPPPGYFEDFSREVIFQIRTNAANRQERMFDRMSWEVPWLQRLIDAFQAKPALAVTFGAAVCALLVGGIVYSESMEFKPVPALPGIENLANVAPAPSASDVTAGFGWGNAVSGALAVSATNSSLNPIQPAGSLFDVRINAEPVSWPLRSPGN